MTLRQKANVMEKTKMKYKWTLENINKYHEYKTSVSYTKSLILAFEDLEKSKLSCDW